MAKAPRISQRGVSLLIELLLEREILKKPRRDRRTRRLWFGRCLRAGLQGSLREESGGLFATGSHAGFPLSIETLVPIKETVLRGRLYAQLRYVGSYADMKSAYWWLLGAWLPQSGHEPDDAPVFEAYLNSPRQVAPTELVTDIHLPLRGS